MKWLVTRTVDIDSTRNYIEWIERRGIAFDLAEDRVSRAHGYDALLLTGGGDVDPCFYNQPPHPATANIVKERDYLELALIRFFMSAGKPVFGVCRGIQVINVSLGGKLVQHVPDFLPKTAHEQHRDMDGKDAVHSIVFRGSSRLSAAAGRLTTVNSSHHQAVDANAVGRGLRVTAVSPAGIIEALESVPGTLPSPVFAVQWHPERLPPNDPASDGPLTLMSGMCS